jgi:putative Mg2+ transporter-C (MgtC) family protein
MDMPSDLEFALRMALATLLSGIVGLERERGERAAGLRTHALVGLGACLVMLVSAFGFNDWHFTPGALDPSRIAAQVISGIGFLGAGVIIFQRDREVVRGLTTAASVWVVAGIGLAVGVARGAPVDQRRRQRQWFNTIGGLSRALL